MTDPISKEDQQWLDALAGQDVPHSLPNSHAQVVRSALQQRRLEIEADASKDRSTELTNLRSRLEREGLIRPNSDTSKTLLQKFFEWLSLNSHAKGSNSGSSSALTRAVPIALAAALAAGAVWLAIQSKAPQVDERLIYRGDPNVVTLLVDDPEKRTNELATELKSLPSFVSIKSLKPNGWVLQVQDSTIVRDYLAAHRIEGVAVNGQITLLVLPSENRKP